MQLNNEIAKRSSTMTKGDVQEALVALYLRLNGYFTTGFIVQSPTSGRVTAELDVLAVRLPNNAEPDRVIRGSPELKRWDDGIDFIIAEVKSRGEPFQFNLAARGTKSGFHSSSMVGAPDF